MFAEQNNPTAEIMGAVFISAASIFISIVSDMEIVGASVNDVLPVSRLISQSPKRGNGLNGN